MEYAFLSGNSIVNQHIRKMELILVMKNFQSFPPPDINFRREEGFEQRDL